MRKIIVSLAVFIFATSVVLAGGGREQREAAGVDPNLREAPMLAARVAAGDLPPLEQRLPREPMVVDNMVDGVGRYGGGMMRKMWMGPSADRWGMEKNSSEYLVHISQDGTSVEPNLAHTMEILDDGKRFVFHLREGLRWSDGIPFTTEDVIFYWEEIVLYEYETPMNPIWTRGGELTQVRALDELTFEIVFAESYYSFPIDMTMQMREFFYPAHYGRTILPQFVGEAETRRLASANDYANMESFLTDFTRIFWVRPEVPSMRPWVPVNDPDSGIFRTERNPFYFKVDRDGRQLPYIDGIEYQLVEDAESIILGIIAGDVDFQDRRVNAVNIPTLMENRTRGDYHVVMWSGEQAGGQIEFNPYPEDEVLGAIFRDVRFRQAVSLAMNRQEIVDIVMDGFAIPRQTSTLPGGAFYSESWERAFADYDPNRASRLLDEIGLRWDNNRQWRLRPDGQVLEVVMTVESGSIIGTFELIEQYARDIGIRWITRVVDRGLWEDERSRGLIQASHSDWNGWSWAVRPTYHLPVQPNRIWHGEYYRFLTSNGQEGRPLSPPVQRLMENWSRFGQLPPGQERDTVAREMVSIWEENLWNIGVFGGSPVPSVISNRLGNHPPDGIVHSDPLRSPLNANMVSFYFR